jgi:TatD DNase family protein
VIKWIDSHAHPHYEPINSENSIQEALDGGISHIMCVATALKDYETLLKFKQSENVYASIGAHPLNDDLETLEYENLLNLAQNMDAIGETGFDFQGCLKQQAKSYEIHSQVAKEVKKPIILHTREAEDITKEMILKHPEVKGVFHCFTGSLSLAEFALEQGWKISFSGIITFKKAEDLREIAKMVYKESKKSILIETDSPFLAPIPFRGKVNRPLYVKYVGEFLSNLLGEDPETFAAQIKENFFDFLGAS